MKIHTTLYLAAIVDCEEVDPDKGTVAVTTLNPITFNNSCSLGSFKDKQKDQEYALYALHSLLETKLRQIAEEIDQMHAKRMPEPPKGVLQ